MVVANAEANHQVDLDAPREKGISFWTTDIRGLRARTLNSPGWADQQRRQGAERGGGWRGPSEPTNAGTFGGARAAGRPARPRMIGVTMMVAAMAAATALGANMRSQARHPVMTMALSVLAALGGFVVAAIIILNLHILVGLEDGYAASPGDVFERSVLLGVVDIALLVAGPVLGIVAASRLRCRDRRGTDLTR